MKDGEYSLDLEIAGEVRRDGWFSVAGSAVSGGDPTYSLEGNVSTSKALSGLLQIQLQASPQGHGDVAGPFSMAVTGESDERCFKLLGLGPLGSIIELRGAWTGPARKR